MTANRQILNAAILSTLCALTMATSARADADAGRLGCTGAFTGAGTLGAAPLFSAAHVLRGKLTPRRGMSAVVTLRFARAYD